MATYTKVKNLNVSTCSSELTLNSIYTIVSESSSTFTIINDVLAQGTYPKALFTPYYEVTKLEDLLPSTGNNDGAYSRDLYGNIFRCVSADSNYLRINSVDNSDGLTVTILVPFVDSFGGVASALSTLAHYGFAINYSQDVAKSFSDRDVFLQYCKTNSIRYNENPSGVIVLTDNNNGKTIIPQLQGIVLNFS